MRRSFSLAVLLACGLGSAACAAVLGFERLSEDGSVTPPSEAGVDAAAVDAFVETGPLCADLGIPDRPKIVDAGSDGPAEVHMAVKVFDLGIAEGFNLDHVCSPTVGTSSCTTKIDEQTFIKYGQDKNDRGLDNAGLGLVGYLGQLAGGFSAKAINERLSDGEFGAVVRLSNWNGTAEDDDVFVEIFPAIGVDETTDAGVATGLKPQLDRGDRWKRDRRFQNVVDASRIKSANAWVTGNRLVASFQSVTLPISIPDDPKPLDILINEGFMSGLLVPDGTSWRLDKAVVGGRWSTASILAQVREIYVKDTAGLKNVYLCDPNLLFDIYKAVKKEVCDGRDLRASSRDDNQGLPCDAFSVGIRLDTYAVDEPGPFADLPVIPPRCTKAGTVPAGDDCSDAGP